MRDKNAPEHEAFLAFARDCLLQANTPQALGLSDEPVTLSPEFHARMAPLLADPFGYGKRMARPRLSRVLRLAACLLLSLALAFGAAMALSPNFRDWVMQHSPVSTIFRFSGPQGEAAVPAGWHPTYVPAGYALVEDTSEEGGITLLRYEHVYGARLVFTCTPVAEGYMLDMDNEHGDQTTFEMNGQTAYLLESTEDNRPSFLTWFNEEGTLAFQLMARLPKDELVKMAQSLENSG